MTTTMGAVHISPHDVCVEDPEFDTKHFYPGKLIWSSDLERDIGELWRDDSGVAWREVNDRKRSDLLTYGHERDEYDAIRAVVRQAEVTTNDDDLTRVDRPCSDRPAGSTASTD